MEFCKFLENFIGFYDLILKMVKFNLYISLNLSKNFIYKKK